MAWFTKYKTSRWRNLYTKFRFTKNDKVTNILKSREVSANEIQKTGNQTYLGGVFNYESFVQRNAQGYIRHYVVLNRRQEVFSSTWINKGCT